MRISNVALQRPCSCELTPENVDAGFSPLGLRYVLRHQNWRRAAGESPSGARRHTTAFVRFCRVHREFIVASRSLQFLLRVVLVHYSVGFHRLVPKKLSHYTRQSLRGRDESSSEKSYEGRGDGWMAQFRSKPMVNLQHLLIFIATCLSSFVKVFVLNFRLTFLFVWICHRFLFSDYDTLAICSSMTQRVFVEIYKNTTATNLFMFLRVS